MGSMPRLQNKIKLRYRKGHTNESQNCRYCLHIISKYGIIGKDGAIAEWSPRCKVMGVKESRRYRVREDYTCDAQEFDETKKNW